MNFPPITPFAFDPQASGITVFHPAAKPLFERARSRANFHAFVASLVGKSRQLRCLWERLRKRPGAIWNLDNFQY